MKKARIIDRALSGLALNGRDIARVSRDRRTVTLRHAWRDDMDGRVLDGVSRAAWNLARELADAHGHIVDIYGSDGTTWNQVSPR